MPLLTVQKLTMRFGGITAVPSVPSARTTSPETTSPQTEGSREHAAHAA